MTTLNHARLRELSARADRDDLIYGPDRDVLARRAAAKALRWRCVETGQRFRFAGDAAKLLGVTHSAISMSRRRGHGVQGRYHFARDDAPTAPQKQPLCKGTVVNLTTLEVFPNINRAAVAMSGAPHSQHKNARRAFMRILRSIRRGTEAYGGEWVRLRTARRVLGLRRESEAA